MTLIARASKRLWFAVFAAAATVAYSSALRAPFEFNDHPSIRQNESIRQLLPLSVPLNPPQNTSVAGRPFVNLTLAVNYAVNEQLGVDATGPNATVGYHVVNVLIHLLCGVLLFAVIRRTIAHRQLPGDATDPSFVAGFATLLWLLHPIQSEAVDYLIQRTELMVSACYVGTLYASIRAWDAATSASRRWWWAAAVTICVLGMASKEVMITAPILIVLYDRAFRADAWKELVHNRGRRAFYAWLFATSAIVVASVAMNARDRSVGFDLGVTWVQYFYTQAWAVARYLRLIAWPDGLTFDYGENPITGLAGVPGLLVLSALAVGAIVAWTRPRLRWLGFLGAWFFLLLAPSSSFVPIRTEIAAERRVYLASAAVFLLAVIALEKMRRRAGYGIALQRAGLGVLAAVLAGTTFVRGLTYANTETLYGDVIAKAPANPRGYIGVALALLGRGPDQYAEAERLFQQAAAADSNSFLAWLSLGALQATQERWQEATRTFERAVRLQPKNLDAISGAARAYVELGDANAAMPYVDRLGPANTPALWALGHLLVQQGRGPEALRYLEPAVAAGEPPSLWVALLSVAYAQSAQFDRAEQAARVATENAGDTASVFDLAGRAMLIAHRTGEARAYLKRALVLDPSSLATQQLLKAIDAATAARGRRP